MSNTAPCGDCVFFFELTRPQPKGRKPKPLGTGHCLKKTIYASNKPGHAPYPPGAKTSVLPYGRHRVSITRKDSIKPECTDIKTG